MVELRNYDLINYGTKLILRPVAGETQSEYVARRKILEIEARTHETRRLDRDDYDPISKRWLDVDDFQREYHEDALRHDLAREWDLEEYTGAIVILDYVEMAHVGWECDSKFVIARIDGELLLRGLDSVEVPNDRITQELANQIDLYRDLSARTSDFLAFWKQLNSGNRISPLDTHFDGRKLSATRELRRTISHVLAKLDDVQIDVENLLNVADALWLVAQDDQRLMPVLQQLDGLDAAIGHAISVHLDDLLLQEKREERERFLSHVRARRDGESDDDWRSRILRFGIEVDDG